MIHTRLRFQVSCEFKAKKQQHRENRNWKPTLYSHYEWPPGRAAEPQPAPQPQPRAGQGRQSECPMLRSMPLTVANFLLLSPGATATTTPFICSGDYSQRQVGSFFKHFLISLCGSAFGSYSVSIPSALCLSVTSTITDPQTEPDTATEAETETGTGTGAGKQQLEWSFFLSPSFYLSPFGWVPSVVQ